MKTTKALRSQLMGGLAVAGLIAGAGAAQAETAAAPSKNETLQKASAPVAAPLTAQQEIESLRQSLVAAERRISALERTVNAQEARFAAQDAAAQAKPGLVALESTGASLSDVRGGAAADGTIRLAQNSSPPNGPVGQAPAAPAAEPTANVVAALPDNSGVLTRPGHWTLEPSFTYSRSSSNRLVFRGVEIVTGVQIGVIEANQAARDTLLGNIAVRYGLTNRAEVELRVPYIYRNDRITTVAQRDATITQTSHLQASNIGDVEFTGRYQLNKAAFEKPILVANLRIKSDTGTSPYEVPRDAQGVAQKLAVGSGFWAVEPSLSALVVTDPAVIFANVSYLHSFSKNINRTIGQVLVGKVTPGDSIGASLGFGFSLNPRFSYSLGYKHNYIFRSSTELGPTIQKSESLQVGTLLFGMSYRVTEKRSINAQFEFGVTSDAPNMSVTFRVPFSY